MERFQRGTTTILVATTVVEVGVDVPEATIMIVEHAERFGLAQLHQLRGRVGRGAGRSACLLLYKGPLGEAARARLETLRETEDGFRIAEEDLRLRGEGDVLGARQAGAPGFRFARLDIHGGLLARAREEAEAALKRDERLTGEREPGLEAAALPVRTRRGRAADRGGLNAVRNAAIKSIGEAAARCRQREWRARCLELHASQSAPIGAIGDSVRPSPPMPPLDLLGTRQGVAPFLRRGV